MKNSQTFVSLLVALAPLATGCAQSNPIENIPNAAISFGEMSQQAIEAPVSLAPHTTNSPPGHKVLFPRQSTPYGVSYEDWASAWWQWALAIPKDENPILGGPCELHQSGQVFFLAGTSGFNDVRSCTMPVGKGIFFPIVNVQYSACPEYGGYSEEYTCEASMSEDNLHQWATEWANHEHTLLLEVDGVSVQNLEAYRAHSETYIETSPDDVEQRVFPQCTGPIGENPCGIPVGSDRPAVADGYWAMMRPLSPGQHTIRFAASMNLPWGGFSLDVTYDLTVTTPANQFDTNPE